MTNEQKIMVDAITSTMSKKYDIITVTNGRVDQTEAIRHWYLPAESEEESTPIPTGMYIIGSDSEIVGRLLRVSDYESNKHYVTNDWIELAIQSLHRIPRI